MFKQHKETIKVCLMHAYRSFPVDRAREWGHIWHNVLDDIDLAKYDEAEIAHAIELLKKGMERESATRING